MPRIGRTKVLMVRMTPAERNRLETALTWMREHLAVNDGSTRAERSKLRESLTVSGYVRAAVTEKLDRDRALVQTVRQSESTGSTSSPI